MTPDQITLGDLVRKADSLSSEHGLFTSDGPPWSRDTAALVLPMDTYAADPTPLLAKEKGFKYRLLIQDVQDIICNLREQTETTDEDLLIEAINYYYQYDAFLDVSKT